jgi:hypothetical protein
MAIALEDKQNVNPADGDFLYGDVRDKTPSVSGTRWDRETMSDYIQFFHRMMDEADLAYNGLLDNDSNGWQFYEAFRKLTKPYKVYAALISQSSTGSPTATVLVNQLSGTPVWSYDATGQYLLTLSNEFPIAKTAVIIQEKRKIGAATPDFITATRTTDSVITVNTVRLSTVSAGDVVDTNGILSNTFIEVRVYD